MAGVSFSVSIPQDKLVLIKKEAERLGVSAAAFIRMKTLEQLTFPKKQESTMEAVN